MELSGIEIFERLMPKRIKRILIIASSYDSFLMADDDMFLEVLFEQNLTGREHFNLLRARNLNEAKEIINNVDVDIVISMMQTIGDDMFQLSVNLKEKNIPFVILFFSMYDINEVPDNIRKNSSGIFLWQGDTKIFSSIINLIEDKMNLQYDLEFGVQCVLLVEDNIKFYSMYLPIIYKELIKQMHLVMSDELNTSKKILRMKARPKIYLAQSYEEAWNIFERYKNNILGVITDVEYPIKEENNEKAGILLAKRIKERFPDMPVLVQSSNKDYEDVALKIGASFINKNSPDISKQLRYFIQRYFGFGDFVFDDGNGKEIARASDLVSMLKVLKIVPDSSIVYHASRNHFSKWLLARTEFEIAYKIRPRKIEEFKNPSEIRNYLIETIHQFIYKNQLGSVLKFDRNKYTPDIPFAKIGYGSIGGKARGLAFIDYLIGKGVIKENINGINIKTPNSVVVASDIFDFFIEQNNLDNFLDGTYGDEELAKIFENINLPDYALRDLMVVIDKMKGPIAVRSSSLLEDSKNYPFAGIYKTYMFFNDGRLYENIKTLEKLIKYVYASTFSKEAIAFRRSNPNIPDEEKMSVIIQNVVGREYIPGYYFPLISGVIQSYNFYPVYPLTHDDPVVHIVMGLGEAIMKGKYFLRYSPAHPNNIHQFASIEDMLKTSQKKFITIPLKKMKIPSYNNEEFALEELNIDEVELSEEMKILFSSYNPQDDRVLDYYIPDGINILTFFSFIKNNLLSLNDTLLEITQRCKDAVGSNVEIEFALNWNGKNNISDLYILQIRHFAPYSHHKKISINIEDKKKIIYSKKVVGNCYLKNLYNLVFVKRKSFDNLKTLEIAKEVSLINEKLRQNRENYLLIGPGRWGTNDRHLGIPVRWNDISMAKVIVEANYDGFNVTPSYGTHFFHNIVSLSIPYFSVDGRDGEINWELIENNSIKVMETEFVVWVKFKTPFEVFVDENEGYVFKGE